MNKNEFTLECSKLNINIDENIYNILFSYYKELNEWNKKFNLTTILEEKEVFLKHFYDSLYLSTVYDFTKECEICDIGTGAGFPGLVLKIVFPNTKLTLIESNNKKCEFLKYLVKKYNLNNVFVINDRAEVYARKNREKFDLITSRAVANLKVLLELSVPTLKINGLFCPLKANIDEETKNIEKSLKKIGCELVKINSYKLPIENSTRNILVIKKNIKTDPLYPREYNKIIKNPL